MVAIVSAGGGAVVGRLGVRADDLPDVRPEQRLGTSGVPVEVDPATGEEPCREPHGGRGGAGSGRRTPSRSRASPPARHGRGRPAGRASACVGAKAASNADGRRGSSRRRRRERDSEREREHDDEPDVAHERRRGRGGRRAARRPRGRGSDDVRSDGQAGSRGRSRPAPPARSGVCRASSRCTCSSVSIASSFISGRTSCPEKRAQAKSAVSRAAERRGDREVGEHAHEVLLGRLGRRRAETGRSESALHPGVCADHRPARVASPRAGRRASRRARPRGPPPGVVGERAERRAAAARGQPPRGERKGGERARPRAPARRANSRLVRRGRRAVRAARCRRRVRAPVAEARRSTLPPSDADDERQEPEADEQRDQRSHRARPLARDRRPARGGRRTTPSRRRATVASAIATTKRLTTASRSPSDGRRAPIAPCGTDPPDAIATTATRATTASGDSRASPAPTRPVGAR